MEHVDREAFVLAFKRGDRFLIPCKANNEHFVGDQECYHVTTTADRLNKLKQVSLGRTAGVCWKQRITASTTNTWRDEQTGTTRKNACNRETMRMMKIGAVMIFVIAQVASAK